jgi:hypothetical protein
MRGRAENWRGDARQEGENQDNVALFVWSARTQLKHERHQRRDEQAGPQTVQQKNQRQSARQPLERFDRDGLHRDPPSEDWLAFRT